MLIYAVAYPKKTWTMLDNKIILIEEFTIEFNDEKKIYEGIALWHEEDENFNTNYTEGAPGKIYMGEPPLNRRAVVATISENGEPEIVEGFKDVLEDEDNTWVLDDIEDEAMTIRETYYEGH